MAQLRILLGLACLGVSVCAACGSSFTGGGSAGGGNAGEAAGPSDAGSGNAAATDSGGDAGETSAGSGGTGASAGNTSAGAAGKSDTAGAGGSSAGAGGSSAGAAGKGGGAGNNGSAGSAGGGAPDCKTLETEYDALLEKARVCDKGSTDECSASSKLSSVGSCGCPVLVNATSAATTAAQKKYKELGDNKCLNTGVMCGAVCLAPKVASCAQQMSGTGTTFVCTAGTVIAN